MITLLSLFPSPNCWPGESSTQTACPCLYSTDDQWSGHGCHKAIGVTKWQTDFPDPQRIPAPLVTGVRAGDIVPRTAIASEVWGINFDSETNTVDVAIRRLRAKVDDPFEKKLIMTVRGMGYRLQAEASQNG